MNVFKLTQDEVCGPPRPLRIVIPGGSGQLGAVLARHFHSQGHKVTVLARNVNPAQWRVVEWNGHDQGSWTKEMSGADVVINLAGRSVNCRYNARNRRQIKESRILSTRAVGKAIAAADQPPALWMNAATATIYRHSFDRAMDEVTGELGGNEPDAPDTWNFSIDIARSWEQEFFSASTPQTRKIALRSAMVMSPDHGGVFSTLRTLVQLGLGGRAGSGRQFVSWIHHADFVRAIEFLISHGCLEGAINICSPNPLPYSEFIRALRGACGVPFGLPATEWMLEIGAFFLRTETELILKSRRVIPGKLLDNGFKFRFPEWPAAAQDVVRSWSEQNHKPANKLLSSSSENTGR